MKELNKDEKAAILARIKGESVGELARALDVWTYQIREFLKNENICDRSR